MIRMPPRTPFLLACLAVTLLGCGGRSPDPGPAPADSADADDLANVEPVVLTVRNDFALSVEVYAVGSGITQRLGRVQPGLTGRFTLPRNLTVSGPVEFVADAGGNQRYRSVSQLLPPGALVVLEVNSQIFNSRLDVGP